LMGLNAVKMAAAIPTLYFSYKFKSLAPLEELFN